MVDTSRDFTRDRRRTAIVQISSSIALLALACGGNSTSPGGGASMGGNGASTSGGSGSGGASSTGGALSTGGSPGTGGARNTGGVISVGGGQSTGGGPSAGGSGSGGVSAAGGRASGGVPSTGGLGNGGATSTGGTLGAGGARTGGAPTAGGASAGGKGGSANSTGGSAPVVGAAGSSGAVPSPGCGKTSTVTFATVPGESGTAVGTGEGGYVTINGRSFAMRLPDNYDKNKPYWLIFGFHWNGGTSKDVDTGGSNGYQMAHFGLQKLSNNGAFFVAPQGLNNGWGGDNLPFVDDMVKIITENYCIDMSRLYTNGFSYGGGMSYAIACARAKVFRGAAIYEGAQLSGCSGGNDPIAYWQMAGTTDGTCTIDMATPMRDKFAKNNGCTIPATEPSRPTSISQSHICTDYTGCSAGHPLRWCVHPAGHGNAIVDGTADLYNSCATPPKTCSDSCKCTWVPQDVWSFFTSL